MNTDFGLKRLGMEIHHHCLDKSFKFLNLNFIICKMGMIMLTPETIGGHFHVWVKKLSQLTHFQKDF